MPLRSTLIEHCPKFPYQGHNKLWGFCDLKVYKTRRGCILVIASEIINADGSYANKGPSVINAVECIATHIRTEVGYGFDFFIEHSPKRGKHNVYEEDFSIVKMQWDLAWHHSPEFKHVTRQRLERLLGRRL